jgi:NADH:ubiquinone oxidoreductase subunit 6 (subunit J)
MANSAASLRAPKSGFMTVQFWVGLLAVVVTFVLGSVGIQLPGQAQTWLSNLPSWIVPGVIGVGIVAAFIYISSAIETRSLKKNGAAPNATIKTNKLFFETSEFWLGLVTVVLSYLHDSGVFAPDVHNSTNTTTLVIALVYTFARGQIKQAYDNAKASGT